MPPKLKINLPPVPRGQDPDTTRWMQALSQMIKSGDVGGGVSIQQLIDAGLAKSDGHGGFIPSVPKPNLTVPPKITGLVAAGAFALVILSWDEPTYKNYSHVEIWRSTVNDIGTAIFIGSSVSQIYTDSIGTGGNNWYWARSVSTSDVRGPFSDPANGITSLDPKYVMKLLTSVKWAASTVYQPFQYVRPTIKNGFNYLCITGGTSGGSEPAWPTTIDATVNDNGIIWKCRPDGEKVPFAIGLVNGVESVVINQAYIEDASITSAKIGTLAADKISTGTLNADRIGASSITANKLNVTSLDAVSATIGLLRTAATGARMEIRDNLLQVYDASGVLRVRMGVW
jgi:hypothetical protein